MGWGHPNKHYFRCNNVFECYFANGYPGWQHLKFEPTSSWGDETSTASEYGGLKFATMRNLMFQNPHIVPNSVDGNCSIR